MNRGLPACLAGARGSSWALLCAALLTPAACKSATPPAQPLEPGAPQAAAPAAADEAPAASRLDLPARPAAPAAPAPSAPSPAAEPEELERLVRERQYEQAHARLGDLLAQRSLDEAEQLLRDARPEEALALVDKALAVAPEEPRALLLSGLGQLQLAEQQIAAGRADIYTTAYLSDALAKLERATPSRLACAAASRAAWRLGHGELALAHAREAAALAPASGAWLLPESAARIGARAAVLAWTQSAEASENRRIELAEACEQALGAALGADQTDSWAWIQVARLRGAREGWSAAADALAHALARQPSERALLDELSGVLRGAPAEAAQARWQALLAARPHDPLVQFGAARARFEAALLAAQPAPEQALAGFETAEQAFARAAELDAGSDEQLQNDARSYRIACRGGRGWALLAREDLEGAEAAFRSMEELDARGLSWAIGAPLGTGVQGLDAIGARLARRYDASRELRDVERAAGIYALLHAREPEILWWSNNAGFFHRDWAADSAALAQRLCAALEPAAPAAERAEACRRAELPADAADTALRARADELARAARERMQISYAAYASAVEQAPEDVRTLNDCALVLVYHLATELPRAEELLLNSCRLAEQQSRASELDEKKRYELTNAWGDAEQNLGVLYLVHLRDAARAKPHFQRAVELGPDPRPRVTQAWLPACDGALALETLPEARAILHWAEPCGAPAGH